MILVDSFLAGCSVVCCFHLEAKQYGTLSWKRKEFTVNGLKILRRIGVAAVCILSSGTHLLKAQGAATGLKKSVLQTVADVPLPGPAVRFDYQSLDTGNERLYIAHMNADHLVVFSTAKRQVTANLDGFTRVHGVIAVPEIDRVYASATGKHEVIAVEAKTLKIVGSGGPIVYPDGLAYAPTVKRVFVSDEHGGVDAVIDAQTNRMIASIPLGGGAGNTVYDAGSNRILVAVHGVNELVAIDPESLQVVGRYRLPGIENPHGIALDPEHRLAFIAGEENHSLTAFDLNTMKELSVQSVGDDPDVLAFDSGLGILYVAAESGTVTVLRESRRELHQMGQITLPHAHTVAVDPRTHLVYLPLENIDGHPLLRIMRPTE